MAISTLNLSELDGTQGLVIKGFDGSANYGYSVSNAGDINGDGIDDVIIGAPGNNQSTGSSYIVFGGSNVGDSGTLEFAKLDGSNGFIINGIDEFNRTGFSVSNAGDINGDGFDDVIIGSPNAGESYIVFGGSNVGDSGALELAELDGSNGFIINDTEGSASFGYSVSSAGDINGDGLDDVMIGAFISTRPYIREGKIDVVFGASNIGNSGILEDADLDGSNGFTIQGVDSDLALSTIYLGDISNAGDINGDGIDDLIIGVPFVDSGDVRNTGASYVVFGGSEVGNSGNFALAELDGSNGFAIQGIDEFD